MNLSLFESANEPPIELPHDDLQWLLVNSVRQSLGIAHKEPVTYEEAVYIAHELAPKVLPADSPLLHSYESRDMKLYKERAAARSRGAERKVSAVEVLKEEIEQLYEEAKQGEQTRRIRTQLAKLLWLKSRFEKIPWTETQAIINDADEALGCKLPASGRGQGYREYDLSYNRRLRVRVLHPDPAEIASGVDLIYETYRERPASSQQTVRDVRIAVLQYKMWDGQTLYASQAPGLLNQMDKMRKTFCEKGYCRHSSRQGSIPPYRLPSCCAFLRPTDKKQHGDGFQVTHAWHIPICAAVQKFEESEQGNKLLRSRAISGHSVTQDTFQELYNRGMLGSRWLSASTLQKTYKEIGLFAGLPLDGVVVHCQEY